MPSCFCQRCRGASNAGATSLSVSTILKRFGALGESTKVIVPARVSLLLALVLIPGVGREVNGAQRWLPLGIVNLQPSEIMKLCAVLYAADYTVRKMAHMHDLKKAFLPMACAMVAVGILLLKEPDFGAFVVIISVAFSILFLGGMRARLFVVLIIVLAAAFAALIIFSPYRRDRIFGFMDPCATSAEYRRSRATDWRPMAKAR